MPNLLVNGHHGYFIFEVIAFAEQEDDDHGNVHGDSKLLDERVEEHLKRRPALAVGKRRHVCCLSERDELGDQH